MTLTFVHLFPVYIYKHKMWTLVLLFTVLKCFGCFGLIQIFKNIVCSGALCYSDGVEVGRRANQDRWEEVILRNSLHQQPGGRTALLCHPFKEKAIHMYGFDLLSVSLSVMQTWSRLYMAISSYFFINLSYYIAYDDSDTMMLNALGKFHIVFHIVGVSRWLCVCEAGRPNHSRLHRPGGLHVGGCPGREEVPRTLVLVRT